MLLFVIFAVCMLVIIATAASTYSHINENFEQNFNTSASLRYVFNKIKSADNAEITADGGGLTLEYDGFDCVIYCADGGLYEKNVPSGGDSSPEGGSRIFDIDNMKITENDGFYSITMSENGERYSVLVRRG
jgi:hypothetical protein